MSDLKIEKDQLKIEAKAIGDYVLRIKDSSSKIKIKVIEAKPWRMSQEFLDTQDKLIHVKNELTSLMIKDLDIKPNADSTLADITIKVDTN